MKALAKFTVTVLTAAALGAVAVHAIHAQTMLPAALDAPDGKAFADWQGAFTQSFGARVLAHGDPRDAIAGQPPSYGLSLPVFDGLEKMQVWNGAP